MTSAPSSKRILIVLKHKLGLPTRKVTSGMTRTPKPTPNRSRNSNSLGCFSPDKISYLRIRTQPTQRFICGLTKDKIGGFERRSQSSQYRDEAVIHQAWHRGLSEEAGGDGGASGTVGDRSKALINSTVRKTGFNFPS